MKNLYMVNVFFKIFVVVNELVRVYVFGFVE